MTPNWVVILTTNILFSVQITTLIALNCSNKKVSFCLNAHTVTFLRVTAYVSCKTKPENNCQLVIDFVIILK